jgi:hypothetical protein
MQSHPPPHHRKTMTRYTLIEYMPEHLRGCHIDAGNSGRYPHNGACRVYVEGEAIDPTELDPRWAEIIEDHIDEQDVPEGAVRTVLGEPADMLAPYEGDQ